MAGEALRDWHRLFGLLLADFFADSPFVVEVERDLSVQQQLLDVVIVRRGKGRFAGRLPDGLEGLRAHNLVTFKSHHEALDEWAMKELLGHYVAYRKLVSPTPSELLPEDQFGLYAVTARYPQQLSGRVPWERAGAGVYDCRWGTDVVRVVVAGELPREPHNAPLHLFSARPELIAFGGTTYRRRTRDTSRLLNLLFGDPQPEGWPMPYTMEDFQRDYFKRRFALLSRKERAELLDQAGLPRDFLAEHFAQLSEKARSELLKLVDVSPDSLEEKITRFSERAQEEFLKDIPLETRLASVTDEQIREYLDRRSASKPPPERKTRRKK